MSCGAQARGMFGDMSADTASTNKGNSVKATEQDMHQMFPIPFLGRMGPQIRLLWRKSWQGQRHSRFY